MLGHTGLGKTLPNEMNFIMNHTPGAGSIAWPVNQQSSMLPLRVRDNNDGLLYTIHIRTHKTEPLLPQIFIILSYTSAYNHYTNGPAHQKTPHLCKNLCTIALCCCCFLSHELIYKPELLCMRQCLPFTPTAHRTSADEVAASISPQDYFYTEYAIHSSPRNSVSREMQNYYFSWNYRFRCCDIYCKYCDIICP